MREFARWAKSSDPQGHWRFTLNGEPIFHWGPLDQGWWPDGLLTPPSDEAMLFDIEWLKAAGFNMIRKHIKVEPRRYYYHCDRLGMMVWQDQVSGGREPAVDASEARSRGRRVARRSTTAIHARTGTHDRDAGESSVDRRAGCHSTKRWGQHRTIEVGKWTVEARSDRDWSISPAAATSGRSAMLSMPTSTRIRSSRSTEGEGGRFDDYIKVMGEFGGHGYPVQGHLWDANRRNWGYGGLPQNKAEYKERYVTSLEMLNELRGKGIAGGVYTQTTDVEGEINGLMTYDRKVIKIPAKELAELHKVSVRSRQSRKTHRSFPHEAFIQEKTDRKPGPVMDAETIRAGLKCHDRALYIKAGWIRDPYITLGPDDYYYLTGTQPNPNDPREAEDPYNIGLGDDEHRRRAGPRVAQQGFDPVGIAGRTVHAE